MIYGLITPQPVLKAAMLTPLSTYAMSVASIISDTFTGFSQKNTVCRRKNFKISIQIKPKPQKATKNRLRVNSPTKLIVKIAASL